MASKPFDATLKELIEDDSASWPAFVGDWPIQEVAVIDADVSTVSAAADKVLRIHGDAGDWLLDLEPASSHAEDIPERLHLYSTLLHRRHGLPVHSVILLLRREANARNLTGVLELRLPGHNEPYDVFRYQVIRLWEEPLARLLAGGLGTLALAPLTDEGSANLPEVLRVIHERLRQEAPSPRAAKIWAATFVLMGLRYPAEFSESLFQGVTTMEESTTYQLIVKRGRIQEAHALLLRLGRSKFGVPADAASTTALERITDLEQLETLGERLLHVSSWQELLAESSAP